MRRSRVALPSRQAAKAVTERFFAKARFCRICITLALCHDWYRNDCGSRWCCKRLGSRLLLFPLAVVLAILSMLGPTVICSTVLLVGFAARLLATPSALQIDSTHPALVATEHLSRVAGRKKTIARLQQAVALPRRDSQLLR